MAPTGLNISQGFFFDDLDQLTFAYGYVPKTNGDERYYLLSMSYDQIGNIQNKQLTDWARPAGGQWATLANSTYTQGYQYNPLHPHRAVQVGARTIAYDADGNQANLQGGGLPNRTMECDEEAQLTRVTDGAAAVDFRYDSSGTRTHRSSSQGVSQYVNQWYSVRNGSLATKHIFAAGTRVASVIGQGSNEVIPIGFLQNRQNQLAAGTSSTQSDHSVCTS